MKIIVGVDDSPHSQAAIEAVKRMSWPRGTRVVVVAAVRPLVGAYVEAYVPSPDFALRVEDEQLEHFKAVAARGQRELAAAGIEAEGRAVNGDPRDVLVAAAASEHADLLVVGSHGRSGLAKLLIGSVASHVVSHAPCDVLVVKSTATAGRSGAGSQHARRAGTTSREEPHSWG
jgi:nucleotide-binding universal stress UspA family protein